MDTGYEEMRSAEEVDAVLGKGEGTVLVILILFVAAQQEMHAQLQKWLLNVLLWN